MNNLLTQIGIITKKNKEMMKATGQNYNIFNILNLSSNETRLHSAFLAHLLNPKESHRLKEKPLETFLRKIEVDFINISSAHISVEEHIGFLNEDTGGRIDILIKDGLGNAVIIENKIYAGDQPKQLLRYHNYGKSKTKQFKLIYLTLEGSQPSNESTGNQGIDFHTLSYSNNIKEWLEECIMYAARFPLVRETINQYIILINQLTNQDMNALNEKEIIDLLMSTPEAVESALTIASKTSKLKETLIEKCLNSSFKEFAQKYGFEFKVDSELNKAYRGFNFYREHWDSRIRIEFQGNNFVGMIYGIKAKDPKAYPSIKRERITAIFSSKYSEWFPYYEESEKYRDWNKQTFVDIRNGNFQAYIEEKLVKIIDLTKDCEL